MELLDGYIKALKPLLPRAQRDDIVKELSENILSQMEDREAELGRPLTEPEQEEILNRYGHPMLMAGRYMERPRSLTFGRELIGPALFPIYRIVLLINLASAVLVFPIVSLLAGNPVTFPRVILQVCLQLGIVTLIFILIDRSQRKSRPNWRVPRRTLLTPISRWQSVYGLVSWIIFGLWWAAVPFFPRLIFGSAAANLKLAPAWQSFYLPILLLLLAGMAQRTVNLIRPQWTWLLPVARLAINAIGMAVLGSMLAQGAFVVIADPSLDPALYEHLAHGFNLAIQWSLISWIWGYLLVNVMVYGCLSVAHIWRRVHNPHATLLPTS